MEKVNLKKKGHFADKPNGDVKGLPEIDRHLFKI